jgi:hypothetical protein
VRKIRSKFLQPKDAKKLVELLTASLSSYTRNGGRKTDWFKKIGISTRTWYKWSSQENPQIRKKTSVRITRAGNLDQEELPEFISESIYPTVFLNKSFPDYTEKYMHTDLISNVEKLFLLTGLFAVQAEELSIKVRTNVHADTETAIIVPGPSGIIIKIKIDKCPQFEMIRDSVTLCSGEFNYLNIKTLIKWLHNQNKTAKKKKIKTLHEQYRSIHTSRH